MSYLNTKQALISHLINSNIPDLGGVADLVSGDAFNLVSGDGFQLTATVANNADNIAFENKKFDPENKQAWLACYLIPTVTEMMGKTDGSRDEQRGIFQVSVMVRHDSPDFDNTQLSIVDSVIKAFKYNTQISYNGQNVDILESTLNNGRSNESWFRRDISINYLTFSDR